MKRLYRSRTDRMLFGVAGGLARYFEVDVVFVRLLWVLAVVAGGWGIAAYIIAAIIMPEEPTSPYSGKPREDVITKQAEPVGTTEVVDHREESAPPEEARGKSGPVIFGYILILAGIYFLLRQYIPSFWWSQFWWLRPERLWPLILVAIGVAVLARRMPR